MGVTANSARPPNLCKLVGKFTGGERSAVAPAGYVDHEIRDPAIVEIKNKKYSE